MLIHQRVAYEFGEKAKRRFESYGTRLKEEGVVVARKRDKGQKLLIVSCKIILIHQLVGENEPKIKYVRARCTNNALALLCSKLDLFREW